MICLLSIWLMGGVRLSLGLRCPSSAFSDTRPPRPRHGGRVTLLPNQLHRVRLWGDRPFLGPEGTSLQNPSWGSCSPECGQPSPHRAHPAAPRRVLSLGLQVLLPEHLRERFVAAALSYITCSSEGELVCRGSDCWCKCSPAFPECNCPDADIQAVEDSLLQIQDSWVTHNRQFEESGEQLAGPHFLPARGEWLGGAGLEYGELGADPGSPTSCVPDP